MIFRSILKEIQTWFQILVNFGLILSEIQTFSIWNQVQVPLKIDPELMKIWNQVRIPFMKLSMRIWNQVQIPLKFLVDESFRDCYVHYESTEAGWELGTSSSSKMRAWNKFNDRHMHFKNIGPGWELKTCLSTTVEIYS